MHFFSYHCFKFGLLNWGKQGTPKGGLWRSYLLMLGYCFSQSLALHQGIATHTLDSQVGMSQLSLSPKPHPRKQTTILFHKIDLRGFKTFFFIQKRFWDLVSFFFLRPSLFNCCLLPLPLLLPFFLLLILFLNLCAIPTPFLFSAPKLFSLEDAICFCLFYHLQLFNIVTSNFFLMPTFLFQEISNSNMPL